MKSSSASLRRTAFPIQLAPRSPRLKDQGFHLYKLRAQVLVSRTSCKSSVVRIRFYFLHVLFQHLFRPFWVYYLWFELDFRQMLFLATLRFACILKGNINYITSIPSVWPWQSKAYKEEPSVNNAVFWDVTPRGSCKNWRSEERITPIIKVKRIRELGTTLAVTSNWSTLRRTSVLTRVTGRHIPEDGILHRHRRENLKFSTLSAAYLLGILGSFLLPTAVAVPVAVMKRQKLPLFRLSERNWPLHASVVCPRTFTCYVYGKPHPHSLACVRFFTHFRFEGMDFVQANKQTFGELKLTLSAKH
jgi:hypothetical protein